MFDNYNPIIILYYVQIDDGTFDECAYVKDDDDLCA